MTSNRELADTAQDLAKELGEEVKTEGLKNAELSKLVEDLTARLAARKADAASGLPSDTSSGEASSSPSSGLLGEASSSLSLPGDLGSSDAKLGGQASSLSSESTGSSGASSPPGGAVRDDGTVTHTGDFDAMRVGGGEPGQAHKEIERVELRSQGDSDVAAAETLPNSAERVPARELAGATTGTADKKPEAPTYKVAQGRGVTSLRGVLGEGEPVSARDFTGGQTALDTLVETHVVEKSGGDSDDKPVDQK